MMNRSRQYIRILPALFLFLPWTFAQTTGELRGFVKDHASHAVAGAKVTARSEANLTRVCEADAEGAFALASLPVGHYTVEVEADGFKSYAQPDVEVTLGHVIEVPVELETGSSTQVIAEETPLVERASTQLGAVMNFEWLEKLPLNTRDTYQLLQLQPGVQSQQGYDLFVGSENPGVVSVNGGRGRANNYNVNGGNANDQFAGVPAIQPSPDAIEEFRVLTNLFDAEYGRNSGSIVNVVTKNGTNDLHGSAFEFFRNRALNTRGFFDTAKPAFNQNQFGGVLGGPVRRNQTFFFVSAEDRQIRQGISSDLVAVPSLAERRGDFSAGSPFSGTLASSYLAGVLNGRTGCAGAIAALGGAPLAAGTPWAAIFPQQRIPSACFDATAADLMQQYVPLPNIGADLFQSVPKRSESAIQPTFRLDHVLNAQQQLSFYYYFDDSTVRQPFAVFQASGANVPGFGSVYGTRNQQFNLAHTWSATANTVNEARFVYFREGMQNYNHPQATASVHKSCASVAAQECFSDPSNPSLGITPGLGSGREGVPLIRVNGAFTIGNNFNGEIPQIGNSFQWSDNLTRTMGTHRAKFGVDVRRERFDQTLYYNINGAFTFGAGGANGVGADNLLPDYLLGLPVSYAQGSAQAEHIRSTSIHLFAQDSWSIRNNLTLNYGLRWELAEPMTDAGRRVQTFRPGQATKIFPCRMQPGDPLVEAFGTTACSPGTPGESVFPLGLVFPGDAGIPDALTATYYKAFAPRIGLAWSPNPRSRWQRLMLGGAGKTSLRMGWGMFYNPMEQLVLMQFSAEPPFGGSTTLSNTMFNTPFAGQDGAIHQNPFNGMLDPVRGDPVDWSTFRPITLFGEFEPHLRPQYANNYNVTLQRQFGNDLLLQLGYVGSQGHRLLASRDLNYGQAQTCLDLNRLSNITGDSTLACGPFSSDSAYSLSANSIPAGFTLHLPYGPSPSVTGPNPTPITLVGLRPYSSPSCNPLTAAGCPPDGVPVFGSIFSQDSIANSNYNSFQMSLEKRALAGLDFQASYTFSKSIDDASSFENLLNPLDYRSSRSLSLFDARHRLVIAYRWQLPRVQTRAWTRHVWNGWSISGVTAFQSGFPIAITSSDDLELMSSSFFSYPGEPDLVHRFQKLNPRNPRNLAFDPSAFAQPQPGVIGNSPRTVCCGPGTNNSDVSLMKTMTVTERLALNFRAELFNLFNHAQFTKVDGNISDGDVNTGGTFGKVLRARDPRLMQFALRVVF